MLVVTWNVNSIRTRLARLLAFLARHQPDVVCLQELRVASGEFPIAELAAAGYGAVVHAEGGRNGVAILSRTPLVDTARGFAGDPVPEQARVVSAVVDGLPVVNAYVVNGKQVGSADYELKLAWLDAFAAWLRARFDPAAPLLVVGDFNVTPDDRDVHDPERWRGQNLCSEPERARLRALFDWGLVDLMRLHEPGPGPFTWWDYREGAFHRGWGLRLDLALGTHRVATRCRAVRVDRDERKPSAGEGKPSDHAPVLVVLD